MHAKKILLTFLTSSIAVTTAQDDPDRDLYLDNPKPSGIYITHPFDEPIKVNFFDTTPSVNNWISVDRYDKNWNSYRSSLWAGLCGDQESSGTEECNKRRGRVIFKNGKDQKSHDGWPLNPGYFYEVCLWDETPEAISIVPDGYCVVYKIEDIPPAIVYSVRIRAIAKEDRVIVSYHTDKAYSRMWIGLYSVESLENNLDGNLHDDDEDWEVVTQAEGKVKFRDVPPGEYKVCFVFVWNEPYDVFKCQKKSVSVLGLEE